MKDFGEIHLVLDRSNIAYTKFILEGYDNLGIMSVNDPHFAKAVIRYPRGLEGEVHSLVTALYDEGVIREVESHAQAE